MKILLVTGDPTISKAQIKNLKDISNSEVSVLNKRKLSKDETCDMLKDVDILIGGSSGFGYLDDNVFNKLPKLKMISILGVGYDWIDIKSANKHNIVVSNARGANAESVAEHNWGMILSLAKRINEADRCIRLENESKFVNYLGNEVYKKTLGVIGLGEIGKRVVRIANAFNMEIIGLNKSKRSVENVKIVSLDELCKRSDIIVVCVSRSEETIGLISKKEVALMKKGVIVVSSSREDVIDKNAVIDGLTNRKIAGFGYDVDIMTEVDRKRELLKFPNVIFTPHTAFYTKEADSITYDVAIDNVQAFIKGEPINVVN